MKDETISKLQQTISEHKRKNFQFDRQKIAGLPQQQPLHTPVVVDWKDISKRMWREGKNVQRVCIEEQR